MDPSIGIHLFSPSFREAEQHLDDRVETLNKYLEEFYLYNIEKKWAILNFVRQDAIHHQDTRCFFELLLLAKDNFEEKKLSHLLFQVGFALKERMTIEVGLDFPRNILNAAFLKVVLTGSLGAMKPFLDSGCVTFEAMQTALFLASKLRYDHAIKVLRSGLRYTFLLDVELEDEREVANHLSHGVLTAADKKKAWQIARLEQSYELAKTILRHLGRQVLSCKGSKLKFHDHFQPYKQLAARDDDVPREWFIRYQLSSFLTHTHTTRQISVVPYTGQNPSTEGESLDPQQRERYDVFKQVHRFMMFQINPASDMSNGHVSHDLHRIKRCLVLKSFSQIQGAIYFSIDYSSMNSTIHSLEVDKTEKSKKFGQILLHSAVFVSLLYRCMKVWTDSSHSALGFYRKQGFVGEEAGEDQASTLCLDVAQQPSREYLVNRMHMTAPEYPLDALIDAAIQFDREKELEKTRIIPPQFENQTEDTLDQALEWLKLENLADACDHEAYQFGASGVEAMDMDDRWI